MRQNKKLSFSQIQEIESLYLNGESATKIAPKFNVSISCVCHHLKKKNLIRNNLHVNRKYDFDTNYFKKIDSPIKSQLLGMIAADGNVNSSRNVFEITLKKEDEHYVEKMKNELKYNGPLYQIFNKRIKRKYVKFAIHSSEIKKDLINLGITPQKSAIFQFPKEETVPEHFIHAFVLGYFEGDGHIAAKRRGKYNRLNCHIAIICSLEFGEKLKQIVDNKLGIRARVTPVKKQQEKHKQIYNFIIGGQRQVLKFCEWMYKDCKFYISRKYERYQFVKSHFDHNGVLIRKENWKEEMIEKIKETRTINGTRAGRILKVFEYFVSPDSKIYYTSRFKEFGKEFGINGGVLYRIKKGTYASSYKGWTIATPEQIAAARASNTLIEKHY